MDFQGAREGEREAAVGRSQSRASLNAGTPRPSAAGEWGRHPAEDGQGLQPRRGWEGFPLGQGWQVRWSL